MKTHNLVIYHCLGCGAILHRELDEDVPQCCARPMVKAAAATFVDTEDPIPEDDRQPVAGGPFLR